MKDSHFRSIIKSVTWRVTATVTTILIAYIITGKIGDALAIGGIEVLAKLALYYAHERAWALLPIGTIRNLFKSSK